MNPFGQSPDEIIGGAGLALLVARWRTLAGWLAFVDYGTATAPIAVSVSTTGGQANGDSGAPSLSAGMK
mgnify:CR=1 FL=1